MLIAAPRTTTYRAGCLKICLRMCFNIRRAFSLIFRTSYATTSGTVRPPEPLLKRSGTHPTLLLLGRLGVFWRLLRGFYGRDSLYQPGDDAPRFGMGLALGFELALDVVQPVA
jgi:hypothetical protein